MRREMSSSLGHARRAKASCTERRCSTSLATLVGAVSIGGLLTYADPGVDAGAHDGGARGEHGGDEDRHARAPLVQVAQGKLRGERSGEVDHFWAIPFAAPPVGALRFRPPRPPEPWRGVRDATVTPPRCPQGNEGQEDCLYLDVHRPSTPRQAGSAPVLLFIHGGSNVVGSGHDNDPSAIVRETGAIVVMPNYRLGSLGWLAHPALSAESPDGASGQYGLMDQQAALRWVHDNIAAFGGDPERIVIAGGSAGGIGVCAHLTSPAVAGLFSGAVMQSAGCVGTPLAEAEGYGADFVNAVGCPAEAPLECLRQKTAHELTAIVTFLGLAVHPGSIVPEDPRAVIEEGRAARVPLLIGGSEHESRAGRRAAFPLDEATYRAGVLELFGEEVGALVLEQYDPNAYDDPFYAEVDLIDDGSLGLVGPCINRDIAQGHSAVAPVYVYEFADATAPVPVWVAGDAPPGIVIGASHGSDEIYWFDRPQDNLTLNDAQRALAVQMRRSLGHFAWHGSPSPRRGPTPWPAYDRARERVLSFALPRARVVSDWAERHECDFWRSLE